MERDVEAGQRPSTEEKRNHQQEDHTNTDTPNEQVDGAVLVSQDSQSTHHSNRPSLERYRSQNGYGVSDEHAEPAVPTYSQEKDPFEVGWDDGDNDPLCPRSFTKARKWLIVLICCGGSFTV